MSSLVSFTPESIRVWLKRGLFWPLRAPIHHHAAPAKIGGVLGSVMLNHTLEGVILGILFAATPVAKKNFPLVVLFCQRLYLDIENPFQVLQGQHPSWWRIRWISLDLFSRRLGQGILFLNVSVELFPHLDQHVGRKARAFVLGNCRTAFPILVNDFLGIDGQFIPDGLLRVIPLSLLKCFGFFHPEFMRPVLIGFTLGSAYLQEPLLLLFFGHRSLC